MRALHFVLNLAVVFSLGLPLATAREDKAPTPFDDPPLANAGPDQTVDEDTPMSFDGTSSSDDVGIVNYTWTVESPVGPVRVLSTLSNASGIVEFDPVRDLVYVLSSQELHAVNVTSGATEWTIPIVQVAQAPRSLAVSPNGAYLAIGIPTQPHGYYDFAPWTGYFASVDLVSQTKLGEFSIELDVHDLLVTSDGYVVAAGGSGQSAGLQLHDARSGARLGNSSSLWQFSRLGLHPSERRFYMVDEGGLSPLGFSRADFDPAFGISGRYSWPYHGDYLPGSDVWASPDGDALVLGGGILLTSTDDPSMDMQYAGRLTNGWITKAAFDPRNAVIAAAEGDVLNFFDLYTHERLGWRVLGGSTSALTIRGDDTLAVVGNEIVAVRGPRIYLYGGSPTYTFSEPGTYSATLLVRDTFGNTSTDTVTITVRDVTAPTVRAGTDRTVWRGTLVNFSSEGSSDNQGIQTYTWSLVDVGPQTMSGPYAEYRFMNAGTFDVTLRATDFAGNVGTDTLAVTVLADVTAPVARAGPDRLVLEGALVRFDGSASTDNVNVTSYRWTFDDGDPMSLFGPNVSYRFRTPGTYVVTLTVEDWEGNEGMDTLTVGVQPVPLVMHEHDSHRYRIGLPTAWDFQRDFMLSSRVRVDFEALGPPSWDGRPSLVVISTSWLGGSSDADLLSEANEAIDAARRQFGSLQVVMTPVIVRTAGTRVATFEICLISSEVCEIWAFAVSARHLRQWVIVGRASASSIDSWRPYFSAAIRSLELLEPASEPAVRTGLATVGGASVAGVALVLVSLRRAQRLGKQSRPRAGSQ